MTIHITTNLSSTLPTSELIPILIALHKNGLRNLHIDFDKNNQLVVCIEDAAYEFKLKGLIDDPDKEKAKKHFQDTYFSDVDCQVIAVNRYAFLFQNAKSFISLIQQAISQLPSLEQYKDILLEMERKKNNDVRRALAESINSAQSESDYVAFPRSFRPDRSTNAQFPDPFWYSRNTHVASQHAFDLSDADGIERDPFSTGMHIPSAFSRQPNARHFNQAAEDHLKKTERERKAKDEKQKQDVIFEEQKDTIFFLLWMII